MGMKGLLSCVAVLLLWGFSSAGPAMPSTITETCWTMGDRHYRTFDGQYLSLLGNCTYIMAKNCHIDKGHPAFEVMAQIKNQVDSLVTTVRKVLIQVHGYTIIMVHGEYGVVRVDYEAWSLPINLGNGKVVLTQSGLSVLLKTDFGLTVQFNWDQYLAVTVPTSYAGKVCGLCGNNNGKPEDDLATPDGTQASDMVFLGRSWRVTTGDDSTCRDKFSGKTTSCDISYIRKFEGEIVCDLLSRVIDGPFRSCHSIINPTIYRENCMQDVCLDKGLSQYLCGTLQAYMDACQQAGIKVYDWRDLAHCSYPKCQENSYFQLCGNACPATCEDPDAPSKCKAHCVETCTCNPGYLLSGTKCVPRAQCGCNFEGHYVQAGKSFWGDNSCSKNCTCNPGGKIECKNTTCPYGQECQVVSGLRSCHPTTSATCQIIGDPHYQTFDGYRYNFQGTCVYQMASVCSKDKSLEPFDILVQNVPLKNRVGSLTKLVEVKIYEQTIVISGQYPGSVLINGVVSNLPASLAEGKVSVYKSGIFAVIQANFGMKVSFDWSAALFVTVPKAYEGAMCGLCGNYNSEPQDDMRMKGGEVAPSPEELGESWLVSKTPNCFNSCKNPCPTCNATQKMQYDSNAYCGLLTAPDGPFRECHVQGGSTGPFNDCLQDVCINNGKNNMQCKILTAYTASCQKLGAKVYQWRSPKFCSYNCPNNSHYEVCASGCQANCAKLAAPTGCNSTCKEGCVCNDGYILSGDQCVPLAKCGCTYEGKYYKLGEVFYSPECEEECRCNMDGEMRCDKAPCGPNEKCEIKNGQRGCYPTGSAQCSIYGDPHYRTFDNSTYNFQGSCTYTVSKACNLDGTRLQPFSVVVENEKWNDVPAVSVAKLVAVEVYGYTLVLRRDQIGLIMVNNVLYNLPVSFNNGAVKAGQQGRQDVIITDFGLIVTYDLVYHVTVTVPSNYQGKTCGLCGNFNNDNSDDYQLPNGAMTKSIQAFGAAWKVAVPGVVCDDGCSGDSCPVVLDPNSYFRDCVYDVCISKGNSTDLCHSINAYASDCQRINVTINSWRTPSLCPLSCPANSHYHNCAETCATPCPGLESIISCPTTCAEGCACNEGYRFNGTSCVKLDQCGCYSEGRTYKMNEVVISNDCLVTCTCLPSGMLSCGSMSCQTDEVCQVKAGIMGCQPRQCQLQAGGVFTLFDGTHGAIASVGAYELLKVCDKVPPAEWFRVVAYMLECGESDLPSVVSIYIFFQDVMVSINDKLEVWVNGQRVPLSSKLSNGITIQASSKVVTIAKTSSLQVTYSLSDGVTVMVNPQMASKVCGACGKVTGTTTLPLVNGRLTSNIQNYINSWRAPDFPTCGN
ncbi:hypothetical protein AGOR_G00034940 [Albula goreensis]|uniref:VWFD domain-containing protein n=1 Tax=Albula goreensis TaxID=1534307 RepID=A0A8T3E1J6_9TELE|nr:hypothetical protein AGOR_G00034940 [Albula goreensis]